MNSNIIKYLKDNKNKFSKEILIKELLKTGYGEKEILECINVIYNKNEDAAGGIKQEAGQNFWDFKNKKTYASSSEKLKDFLLGFLGPWAAGFVVGIIPIINFLGGTLLFVFEIFAVVYLFKRRRFISYGLMTNFVLGILFIVGTFIFLASGNFYF